MEAIIFAQKSKGSVTMEDFKPLETEGANVKPVKGDLVFKQGNFTIASSYIDGQRENQGWNVGINPATNKVYLFRNQDETGTKRMKFLKGDKPFPRFKSESIELALDTAGVNKEQPMWLIAVTDIAAGLDAFLITNETSDEATQVVEDAVTQAEAQNAIPDSTDDAAVNILEPTLVEQEELLN